MLGTLGPIGTPAWICLPALLLIIRHDTVLFACAYAPPRLDSGIVSRDTLCWRGHSTVGGITLAVNSCPNRRSPQGWLNFLPNSGHCWILSGREALFFNSGDQAAEIVTLRNKHRRFLENRTERFGLSLELGGRSHHSATTGMATSERSALVLYGSETGNAQDVAEELGRLCERLRFTTQVLEMNSASLVCT